MDFYLKRQCCVSKGKTPTNGKDSAKKNNKKTIDSSRLNRSSGKKCGKSISYDDELHLHAFNESTSRILGSGKLCSQTSKTIKSKGKKTPQGSKLDLDRCSYKQAISSMRTAKGNSQDALRDQITQLQKENKEVLQKYGEVICQLESVRRSEGNLIALNESLTQQLLNMQKNNEQQHDRLKQKDKRLNDELISAKFEAQQQKAKSIEINCKISSISVERDGYQRQAQSLLQELRRERLKVSQLETSIMTIRQKLLYEENSLNLKTKDFQNSNLKLAEELSGKYTREVNQLETSHKQAVRKIQKDYNGRLDEFKSQWKNEIVMKDKEIAVLRSAHNSDTDKLSVQLSKANSALIEKQLLFKTCQRKIKELQGQIDFLKQKIDNLQKQKIRQKIEVDDKEEAINHLQKLISSLKDQLQIIDTEKQQYYQTVIQSRDRISRLQQQIRDMADEETDFMTRFEAVIGKVQQLESHVKMDRNIKETQSARIHQLEESNRILQKMLESDSQNSHRQLYQLNKEVEELRCKVKEYKVRWEDGQEKIQRLNSQIQNLKKQHIIELSQMQNQAILSTQVKRIDNIVENLGEKIKASTRTPQRTTKTSGDILRNHDMNFKVSKWNIQ